MGEQFKAFFENKPNSIYKSNGIDGIVINKFEDTKKDRPKSAEMQKAYPELYDFLMKKEGAKKFNVGILHLDGVGSLSKKLAHAGEGTHGISRELIVNLLDGLKNLAKKIKEEPESELAQLDFLTAYSRLAGENPNKKSNSENLAEKLGFETFKIDEEEDIRFYDSSHRHMSDTQDIMIKKGTLSEDSKIIENSLNRPAKIALISREKILEIYGK